jgi:peptidyl-prolyl cis-trans isomerase D
VRAQVIAEESVVLAKKAGEAKLAALKLADETTGFGSVKVVSRAKNDALNGVGFDQVMKADVSKLPTVVGAELAGQGYAVYRISKVAQAEKIDAPRRLAEQKQITNALAQQEMLAYVEALKQKAKVKIVKPVSSAPAVADDRF